MPIPFSDPTEIQPRQASSAMQFTGSNLAAIQAWVMSWPEGPGAVPTLANGDWFLRTWDDRGFKLTNDLFSALYRTEADYASTPEDLG